MVSWFGDEQAPCLVVTTFENALVTSSLAGKLCAMNCKDKVQQLVIGRWPQGLAWSGQPHSWHYPRLAGIKRTSDENLCCCVIAREMETEIARCLEKSHRKFLLSDVPHPSWQLRHRLELSSNQTISVWLRKTR